MRFGTYMQMPPLNTDANVSSRARGLKFGLSLHLHPYFMCAVKALLSLCICLPEHSLPNNAISNKISCAGSYD